MKNQQPYCKSVKGTRTFTCEANAKWDWNSKNDCECKTACQAPEEQFSHIPTGSIHDISWIFYEFDTNIQISHVLEHTRAILFCRLFLFNIILDVLPRFDSCKSSFKNAKCKAKCPGNTYTRAKNAIASSIGTKCSCQGSNCLWAVGRAVKADLYCISM